MIIKLAQNLKWRSYRSNKRLVKAVKMREDFQLETSLGFVGGKRGDWVVETGKQIRFPCEESVFLKTYRPLDAVNPGESGRWEDR